MSDGFHIATPEEIRSGKVTDVYFLRGRDILRAEGENPHVVAEVRVSTLPGEWPWGVFAGLEEAVNLLEDHAISVDAVPEGTVFYAEEPVLVVSGPYLAFGILETALLGLLCQASGTATVAARAKLAAEGRPVYSFGARRIHPAVAPMVERAAYVGGCDGVSTVKAGELIGADPVGTMAHALVLILGEERAWLGLDRLLDKKAARVALVDTYQDEKFGALAAARVLGKRLSAVRLDTPASRRGNFAAILREVRWELDAAGFVDVQIFVSGGIGERQMPELNRYVDAYGVGTSISNAPVVDFALDIVEVDGRPRAKRGKLSGRKHLWICPECDNRGIAPWAQRLGNCPRCGHRVRSMHDAMLVEGKRKRKAPLPRQVREYALDQIALAPNPFHRP
jgi:nicotinate phosphoribosyltransferase